MISASVLKPYTLSYPVKDSLSNRNASRALRYHDRLDTYVNTRKPTIITQLGLSQDYRTAPVQRLSSGENLLSLDRVRQKEMLIMYGLVPPPGMLNLSMWVHGRLSELAPFVNAPNYTPTLQNWIGLSEDQRAQAINTSGSPGAVNLIRAAAQARVARGIAAAAEGNAVVANSPQVAAINAERARVAAQAALDVETVAAERVRRGQQDTLESERLAGELRRAADEAAIQIQAAEIEKAKMLETARIANQQRSELLSLEVQRQEQEAAATLQKQSIVFQAGKVEAQRVAELAMEQERASARRRQAADEEALAQQATQIAGERALVTMEVVEKYNNQLVNVNKAKEFEKISIQASDDLYNTLIAQKVAVADAERMRLDAFKMFSNQWADQVRQVYVMRQQNFEQRLQLVTNEAEIERQAQEAANMMADEMRRRQLNEATVEAYRNNMYEWAFGEARMAFDAYVARRNGLPRDTSLPGSTRLLAYRPELPAIMAEGAAVPVGAPREVEAEEAKAEPNFQQLFDRVADDDDEWSEWDERASAAVYRVASDGAGSSDMLVDVAAEDRKRTAAGAGRISEIVERESIRRRKSWRGPDE